MTPALLEITKILSSIVISERTTPELRQKATDRLEKIFSIIDANIEDVEMHIKEMKEAALQRKFMS